MPLSSEFLSRRALLAAAPALGFATLAPRAGFAAPEAPPALPGPVFPTQDPALAREMVGVSHGNAARVRELLALHPTLALATWDWGFGDWESALGAASHVGNREIAELLIEQGARPDLFAAAMLGQLDVVKAFVAARPGCQSIPGPHGIPLLAHARAGGERAAPVVAWLESVGGAEAKPPSEPLADADRDSLLGVYRFGPGESDTVAIAVGRAAMTFERAGGSARNLVHVGGRAFFPVGAPRVRIRFSPATGTATELAVHDPGLVLTARRPGA